MSSKQSRPMNLARMKAGVSRLLLPSLWIALLAVSLPVSAGTLSQELSSEDPAALAEDARKQGDAARGAILFHQASMACSKCHATGQPESPLGPDLATLGSEASDEHLLESVLHPSKVIKKDYRSITVVTARGQTHIGLLVEETPKEVVFRDAAQEWKKIRIARGEVEEIQPSALSIMPTGQVDVLENRQQFLDLAKYLIEIRNGGPERARELKPDPAAYTVDPIPELQNALSDKPLGEPELKLARALFTSRGCVGCHQFPHDKAPSLNSVSAKYDPMKDGLMLLKTSFASGSVGKWGKVVMPPQAHLQDAERHLLARWVLSLHQSGEKPPRSIGAVENFASFDILNWTQYEYYGPRTAKIEWNGETEDLRLRNAGGGAAGFYPTGQGRAPVDLVSLTVKEVRSPDKQWGQVGLMISTVAQPQLLDAQMRYEWLVRRETNGLGWVYRVRKDVGSGSYELYSSDPVDATAPVRLDIVRDGNNYAFYANEVLHYTTGDNTNDAYGVKARDAMTYFGVTFGGGAAMSATIDDLSTGIALSGEDAALAAADLFVEQRNGAIIRVLEQPVVYRTYLPDAPSRAIAVGLPGGLSYGFDAQNCKLLYAWRGGFLDVSRSWTGWGGWYSKLLGEKFYIAPPGFPLLIGDLKKEPVAQFKGYDLVEGYPIFKYLVDGISVRHQIVISEVDEGVLSIRHKFHLPDNTKPVYFIVPKDAAASYESEDAEWIEGRWKVHADKLTRFSIGVAR